MPRDHYGRFGGNANAYVSEQIRNEIQRFESVHPCIYTVYDLIELIPDPLLQNQLRDQVVCIEEDAQQRYLFLSCALFITQNFEHLPQIVDLKETAFDVDE
ncbi:unnamed protein product [Gongylonema pulchrum]|uniref:Rho-GAP domain-containing protein n=1 Tax=Gongylonema pulchrum TaxID=637853 RepID=A0A183EH86_9BILA|nr:unnamed protein product [Gongylonema pulchrum]